MNVRGTSNKGRVRRIVCFVAVIVCGAYFFIFSESGDSVWQKENQKKITVIDSGLELSFSDVSAETVGDFLSENKIILQEGDSIFPMPEEKLFPSMTIRVARAREITVVADGKSIAIRSQAPSVGGAIVDAKIALDEDDIVKPEREASVVPKMKVVITRVRIEELSTEKAIPFEKKVTENAKLSWRKTVVTQKGEKGIERQTYRVSTHDGKEVNRKIIKSERVKEPVTEIVTQGTEVKLGKSHTGAASWYAWTGTMAAANPWLPKGSFVKVTNVDNGKSVIVVINDRGPFVPGRIIDLDKVAFAKIASVGAGVINVKMEEIAN